jgi:hypothetical protein
MAIGVVHVRSWQVVYKGVLPQYYLDQFDAVQRGEVWERYLCQEHQVGEAVLVAGPSSVH